MKKALVTIGVLAVVLTVGYAFISKPKEPIQVACTMEAKLCPDGSYVGRSGPLCEFTACPTPTADNTAGWKVFSDSSAGFTFKYPEKIDTTFINVVDWPPKVQLSNTLFSCTEAGQETAQAGQTTKKTIDGKEYCITKESEGAAGSTYTQYAYATQIQNKVAFFTFTLRFVQCQNFDKPQSTACEKERSTFDIDPLINQIIQTTHFL